MKYKYAQANVSGGGGACAFSLGLPLERKEHCVISFVSKEKH